MERGGDDASVEGGVLIKGMGACIGTVGVSDGLVYDGAAGILDMVVLVVS